MIDKGEGISFLIPFHDRNKKSQRMKNWIWLKKYWQTQLPEAEIVVGIDEKSHRNPKIPFSKSCAVNNAASRAHGDIFVIVDADGYAMPEHILTCAEKIRKARKRGNRLWFIPYRQFFRLTEAATAKVLKSSPEKPCRFSTPPPANCILDAGGSQHGHWFGALIQILPREAFDIVGGWDPRFRGWGGEDHAIARATDTIYWMHKTLPGQVLHLWHPMLSPDGSASYVGWEARMWSGQTEAGLNNDLAAKYYGAGGHPKRMRKLVEEGRKHKCY